MQSFYIISPTLSERKRNLRAIGILIEASLIAQHGIAKDEHKKGDRVDGRYADIKLRNGCVGANIQIPRFDHFFVSIFRVSYLQLWSVAVSR